MLPPARATAARAATERTLEVVLILRGGGEGFKRVWVEG